MSYENNSESNSNVKRSRYEMESSQSSVASSLSIDWDKINGVDTAQNVAQPLNEQNERSDDGNSSKLLEMMLEMKLMLSQLKVLTKRLDDIQVERAADDTVNVASSPAVSVDFSELGLVLEKVDDVNQFESKLKSKHFKAAVLNSLLRIGGTTGGMEANKVVRTVFSTLFDEELKRKYTWAGRDGRAAFKDLHEIRKLIFEVVVQADHKYSSMQCDQDIAQKLLRPKRPSSERAPLDLSLANYSNLSANSQMLNGLPRATDPIPRIVYSPAVTPLRVLYPNGNVSDTWSYFMDSVFSRDN